MNVLLKIKELNNCIIRKISNNKITPVQGEIIKYVATNKDVYQKDIEKILRLRRSTISGILHTMEKNELINKTSDEKDFRIKKITLTQKAVEMHKTADLKFKKLNEEMCENISIEELNIFLNVVNQMINNIRKED